MRAWIENQIRAMVELSIASHATSKREVIEAWIDTAFDGHLVMPKSKIIRLGLGVLADTDAVLADGSTTSPLATRLRVDLVLAGRSEGTQISYVREMKKLTAISICLRTKSLKTICSNISCI